MRIENLLILACLTGCAIHPLRPGQSRIKPGKEIVFKQSENPKEESTQVYERSVEYSPLPTAAQTTKVTEKVTTKIGASQKDDARSIAAKLASLKGIVWLGAAVFLFGVASAFWAPLRVIVGSLTTSLMIAAAGLVLIVLPCFVVDNEILIISVALGGATLYWLAHRNGSKSAKLKILEGK
jgi:hypothetical protein